MVANPPYLPDGVELEPEVAEHDPAHALFGGPDGMAVIAPILVLAARWLNRGGLLAVEHDDTTSEAIVEMLMRTNIFEHVMAHPDFGGTAPVRDRAQEGDTVTQIFDCTDQAARRPPSLRPSAPSRAAAWS